ncbi:prolipoprotein diacylglyceryl transferase [Candidatus Peregrinibacteria bacterium]|nr:prolipoprotein diacylglyceryl transferase [Candidatus Peregrinibacteria bacterium]
MYPILFEFGIVTVFSLWFFIAVGFVVAALLFIRLSKRYRVRLALLSDHGLFLFLWTLLVSRLTFVLMHTELYFYRFQFTKMIKIFALWDKGLSFWGAAIAWFLGIWFLTQRHENAPVNMSRLWDILSPAILIGMFFGNIGAFLDGINYGTPTNLPWGMAFRNANVKYISEIHPTQLYAAFYVLVIACTLLWTLKMLRGRLPGFVTEAGIFLFSLMKFTEEFLRGDDVVKIFSLRLPQLLAFCALIVSGYLLYQRYENRNGGDPERILKNFAQKIFKKLQKPNLSINSATSGRAAQNQTT